MSEIILPRWDGRFDITRKESNDFSDAAQLMLTHFYFYERIYNAVAPYEARQRQVELDGSIPEIDAEYNYENYRAPTVQYLEANIRRGTIGQDMYEAVLTGISKFLAQNKCKFALPVPHPTTLHSIQLPKGGFVFNKVDNKITEVAIAGLKQTFFIEGLRNPGKVQHIVVRPKSSSSGVANLNKWEMLTFEEHQGYIPLWVDSTANPRFAGTI